MPFNPLILPPRHPAGHHRQSHREVLFISSAHITYIQEGVTEDEYAMNLHGWVGKYFSEVDDQFIFDIGQEPIPKAGVLTPHSNLFFKKQIESFSCGGAHGIAPVVNHAVSRNAIDDLPVSEN